MKEGQGLVLQIPGEVCSRQGTELQQRLQSKNVLAELEEQPGASGVEWSGVSWWERRVR